MIQQRFCSFFPTWSFDLGSPLQYLLSLSESPLHYQFSCAHETALESITLQSVISTTRVSNWWIAICALILPSWPVILLYCSLSMTAQEGPILSIDCIYLCTSFPAFPLKLRSATIKNSSCYALPVEFLPWHSSIWSNTACTRLKHQSFVTFTNGQSLLLEFASHLFCIDPPNNYFWN